MQFAASETLFASSWSCFSSSEDAMEYSKEFVTAVVLGKDLVPRQVEKCLNFLMSFCCSIPVTCFYQKHLDHVCLQFPHLSVLVCLLLVFLVTCIAASLTWTTYFGVSHTFL